eukprot:s2500_g5.t1
MWRKPSTGGIKEWHIEAELWDPSMPCVPREIKKRDAFKPFLTSAAQAYPEGLNEWLAKTITENTEEQEQRAVPEAGRMEQCPQKQTSGRGRGGVFPGEVAQSEEFGIELPDPSGHSNYSSVDGDDMAELELQRLMPTGIMKAFDDWNSIPGLAWRQAAFVKAWNDHEGERRQSEETAHPGARPSG